MLMSSVALTSISIVSRPLGLAGELETETSGGEESLTSNAWAGIVRFQLPAWSLAMIFQPT